MTDDERRSAMLNEAKWRDTALARAVTRCREAAATGGVPNASWSMGEKLMTALVFRNTGLLESLGYSEAEAVDRLRGDFDASIAEFPEVLEQIRTEL